MRSALRPTGLADRISAVRQYVQSTLSEARFAHVLRTTEELQPLCARNGIDAAHGELCGLGHDLCRELAQADLLAVAARDGEPIASWERADPVLLHGRAAAAVLAERFGVFDDAVLDAIRWHTTGRVGMGKLAKALFIADYVERGRTHVDEIFRARVRDGSLDDGVALIVTHTIRYLRSMGREPAPPALDLQAWLSREGFPA